MTAPKTETLFLLQGETVEPSKAIKKASPIFQVWNCGGGTQSCAIAVLIIQGRLPKPDFSVIADTHRERNTTWEYLDAVLRPELSKVGVEIVRIPKSKYAFEHNDIWSKSGSLLIPAYSNITGTVGKMGNFCTKFWKIEAVDNWLSRENGITRSQRVKWIGFSLDEAPRVLRMQAGDEWKKGLIRFPLVDDAPMMRAQSIRLVEDMGWPTPPRSACYICANQGDHEWRDLKENSPQEFWAAVELEREIHKRDPHAFLHQSCVPLDQVDFSQSEDLFSRPCDSGVCFI